MINLSRIRHVTYQVTDLDSMEAFLVDFGLHRAARTDNVLYMRAADDAQYAHVSVLGDTNQFLAVAFEAGDASDLAQASEIKGASRIEDLDAPGGGKRVRLVTPSGNTVEIVHGIQRASPIGHRPGYQANYVDEARRLNQCLRPAIAPSEAVRLAHAVLWATDSKGEVDWLKDHFGLVASDHFSEPGNARNVVGTFLRFDRGDEFVDHHVVLVGQSDRIGCHHCSFEVPDIDSVFAGHEHLVAQGHNLDAGVGRHLLGSMVFDYWYDPFGNRIEHYTDGDVVNNEHKASVFSGTPAETSQWGAKLRPEFFQ